MKLYKFIFSSTLYCGGFWCICYVFPDMDLWHRFILGMGVLLFALGGDINNDSED